MKRTLMIVTAEERTALLQNRKSEAFLDKIGAHFRRAEERREALRRTPPEKGYLYRCKHCAESTNCPDEVCLPCAIL